MEAARHRAEIVSKKYGHPPSEEEQLKYKAQVNQEYTRQVYPGVLERVEAEVEAQSKKVMDLKATKASKEEVTAEVNRLKELKKQLPWGHPAKTKPRERGVKPVKKEETKKVLEEPGMEDREKEISANTPLPHDDEFDGPMTVSSEKVPPAHKARPLLTSTKVSRHGIPKRPNPSTSQQKYSIKRTNLKRVEAEVEAQSKKVMDLKATKASKEEVTAEVNRLKELKKQLPWGHPAKTKPRERGVKPVKKEETKKVLEEPGMEDREKEISANTPLPHDDEFDGPMTVSSEKVPPAHKARPLLTSTKVSRHGIPKRKKTKRKPVMNKEHREEGVNTTLTVKRKRYTNEKPDDDVIPDPGKKKTRKNLPKTFYGGKVSPAHRDIPLSTSTKRYRLREVSDNPTNRPNPSRAQQKYSIKKMNTKRNPVREKDLPEEGRNTTLSYSEEQVVDTVKINRDINENANDYGRQLRTSSILRKNGLRYCALTKKKKLQRLSQEEDTLPELVGGFPRQEPNPKPSPPEVPSQNKCRDGDDIAFKKVADAARISQRRQNDKHMCDDLLKYFSMFAELIFSKIFLRYLAQSIGSLPYPFDDPIYSQVGRIYRKQFLPTLFHPIEEGLFTSLNVQQWMERINQNKSWQRADLNHLKIINKLFIIEFYNNYLIDIISQWDKEEEKKHSLKLAKLFNTIPENIWKAQQAPGVMKMINILDILNFSVYGIKTTVWDNEIHLLVKQITPPNIQPYGITQGDAEEREGEVLRLLGSKSPNLMPLAEMFKYLTHDAVYDKNNLNDIIFNWYNLLRKNTISLKMNKIKEQSKIYIKTRNSYREISSIEHFGWFQTSGRRWASAADFTADGMRGFYYLPENKLLSWEAVWDWFQLHHYNSMTIKSMFYTAHIYLMRYPYYPATTHHPHTEEDGRSQCIQYAHFMEKFIYHWDSIFEVPSGTNNLEIKKDWGTNMYQSNYQGWLKVWGAKASPWKGTKYNDEVCGSALYTRSITLKNNTITPGIIETGEFENDSNLSIYNVFLPLNEVALTARGELKTQLFHQLQS